MWFIPAAVALMAAQTASASEAPPARAQQYAPAQQAAAKNAEPEEARAVRFRNDPVLRFTIPVQIGGQTWHFLVDTGAEKSGVSLELVHSLGLPTGEPSEVTGFAGSEMVPTVPLTVSGLASGPARSVDALAFSRDSIGADGFLGLDSLRDGIVLIDFGRNAIFVRHRSHLWFGEDFDAVTSMKVRDHRMVFSTAAANGVPLQAILDTGSSLSVGNDSLKAELLRRGKYGTPIPIQILSVTGKQIAAEYVILRNVMIGQILVRNLPVAFAGPEPFEELGLGQQPAVLLGMDVLRQFDKVEIDFQKNRVRFITKDPEDQFMHI